MTSAAELREASVLAELHVVGGEVVPELTAVRVKVLLLVFLS